MSMKFSHAWRERGGIRALLIGSGGRSDLSLSFRASDFGFREKPASKPSSFRRSLVMSIDGLFLLLGEREREREE